LLLSNFKIFLFRKKIQKLKNYILTKIDFGSFLPIFIAGSTFWRREKSQTFAMPNFDPERNHTQKNETKIHQSN